jgi:hypothetical protein
MARFSWMQAFEASQLCSWLVQFPCVCVCVCLCAKWVKKCPPATGVQSISVSNILTKMAVNSVWPDIWRFRYVTPHAIVCASSRFLTLCAASTKNRAGICSTGNMGSTTDIAVVVLVVQLPVQTDILTQVRYIQTLFEEQHLWLYVLLLNQYNGWLATKAQIVLWYAKFKSIVCLKYEFRY